MRKEEDDELFNRAYALAWCRVRPPCDASALLELSDRVEALIKASINTGMEDAQAIADATVAALKSEGNLNIRSRFLCPRSKNEEHHVRYGTEAEMPTLRK